MGLLQQRLGHSPSSPAATAAVSPRARRQRLIWTLVAGMLATTFVLPLVWLISSSLQSEQQIFARPPVWLPNPIVWENYVTALTRAPFGRFFLNTIFLAVVTAGGTMLASALTAYGFARLEWPGRDALFFVVLCSMMLPAQVTLVPLYILFAQIGWVGSYLPLLIPPCFGMPFYIFLLRQFFRGIPQELSDAARMDGCSELGIFWRVILPLARPALAAVVLFRVLDVWGDFLEPLIYINRIEQFTLSLGLVLFNTMYYTEWSLLMAASVTMTVPIILLFFVTQRFFIEGVTFSGLKL